MKESLERGPSPNFPFIISDDIFTCTVFAHVQVTQSFIPKMDVVCALFQHI